MNVEELRNDLIEVFQGLRSGAVDRADAVEINNTAGKIISTVKLQLAQAALCGTKPDIPFLNVDGEQQPLIEGRVANRLQAA